MKILIDARLYGLENAGLGRYIINLIYALIKLDKKNNYVVLLRNKYFNELKFPGNWKKVKAEFGHYSWQEQIKLPALINKLNPDLVHFPHFNVPLFCSKPYVVTIHDMLMHGQKGLEATTLSPFVYFIKRLGYRLIFDNAIKKAGHILVPSHTVAKELADFYHLPTKKITVTYESY